MKRDVCFVSVSVFLFVKLCTHLVLGLLPKGLSVSVSSFTRTERFSPRRLLRDDRPDGPLDELRLEARSGSGVLHRRPSSLSEYTIETVVNQMLLDCTCTSNHDDNLIHFAAAIPIITCMMTESK